MVACGPHWRSRHTLLVILKSSTCYSNTSSRGKGGRGERVSGEEGEVRCDLLVDIDVKVGLVHYLLSNQLLNHIL